MKEFRVAHIVPVSHLQDTVNNQYHMCLAHLVEDETYKNHFKAMSKAGKFVLMDNGAAEGSQLNFDKLFEMYEEINPTEIVLPDTLLEMGSTIQKSRNFLAEMQKRDITYRVMAVPQGKTLDEWAACARIFVKDDRINTIGVSKFLNVVTKDDFIRFKALGILKDLIKEYERDDLEVHLLGCDEGPLIVNMCHTAYNFVRGCDSAFAYIAAQADSPISLNNVKRPKGSIDFLNGEENKNTVREMVAFNIYAGVEDNNDSDSWK